MKILLHVLYMYIELETMHLCQAMVQHFWKKWTAGYIYTVQMLNKWKIPMTNLQVGDIVCLKDETLASATA